MATLIPFQTFRVTLSYSQRAPLTTASHAEVSKGTTVSMNQLATAPAAFLIAVHTFSQIFLPVSVLVKNQIRPATRAVMPIMMSPIGPVANLIAAPSIRDAMAPAFFAAVEAFSAIVRALVAIVPRVVATVCWASARV